MNRREALGALAGLAATACAAPQDHRLTLWHAYREGEALALEAACARIAEAHPELAVRLVAIPFDAFVNKVSVAVPNGNGPDLFLYAHDRVGDWAARGILEPLEFWVDLPQVERFFPRTLDALVYRGGLYGLPLAFKTLALYRDTTHVPQAPATTAELEAAVRALRARDTSIQGIAWELDSLYFHAPWLHGFGGAVYRDTQDTLALDSAEAAASLAFVRRWLREHIIPEEATSALITSLFRSRKLAFAVNGPWFQSELADHSGWAVSALPVVSETGRRAAPYLGVEAVMVSAHSPRRRQAFELGRALTSDAMALLRWRDGGQLPANQATYAEAAVQADPIAGAFRQQVEDTVAMSNRPHMRQVWSPAKRALSKVIVGGAEPRAALAEAVREIGP